MFEDGDEPVFPANAQEIIARLHEFPSYLYEEGPLWSCDAAAQVITGIQYDGFSKNEAITFDCLSEKLEKSIYYGEIEYVDTDKGKKLRPEIAIEWAKSQGWKIPDYILEHIKPITDADASKNTCATPGEFPVSLQNQSNSAKKNKASFEHEATTAWKSKAREIGESWMNKQRQQGEDPGVIEIAKYVEGELSNQNITGQRGKFLDWETIKREALTGITGKQANGKGQKM